VTAKSQLMLAEEATFGVYATPNRAFEFTGEGIDWSRERIESRAWRAGQRVISAARWKPGRISVGGSLDLEVANKGFGILFKHALGAIATSTPGGATSTRDHKATLGDLKGKSLTIQVGIEDRGGVVRPFSFLGCKITTWELRCAVGELLTMSLGILGRDLDTSQTLETPVYPSGQELFSFVEGSLTVGGSSVPVREFAISGDNRLPDDDYAFGSALRRDVPEPALRQITGTFNADFDGLTEFNRFKNGTEAQLLLRFEASVIEASYRYTVQITANVRYDGEAPKVSGPEETRQPIAFAVTAPATGEPIEILYRTTDTSP
jgi:hypothetical protein